MNFRFKLIPSNKTIKTEQNSWCRPNQCTISRKHEFQIKKTLQGQNKQRTIKIWKRDKETHQRDRLKSRDFGSTNTRRNPGN